MKVEHHREGILHAQSSAHLPTEETTYTVMNTTNSTDANDTSLSFPEETTVDPSLWFTPIANTFAVVVNSISLFFAFINVAIILIGQHVNPTVFNRLSLKLVLGIQCVNTLYHANYIASMYLESTGGCILTTSLFVFLMLLEIGLTSCIA
jgi:hypothetical protein